MRGTSLVLVVIVAACSGAPAAPPTSSATPSPYQTALATPSAPPTPTQAPTVAPATTSPTPKPSPTATEASTPVASGVPDSPAGFLDRALASADQQGGFPHVTAQQLVASVNDAITSNASVLPGDYPQSANDVPQVKYCTTGREPGLPSQDKDLARSLECPDTAIFAWIGWTLTHSEKFVTAFNDAVYFLENNASQDFIDQGLERIRAYTPPS